MKIGNFASGISAIASASIKIAGSVVGTWSSSGLGIGIAVHDGTLHVHTGTAGSVTASADGDDLVVENSTAGGISILTPDASNSHLYFGSPTDNLGALLRWNHDADQFSIGTANTGGVLRLLADNGSEKMRLEPDGGIFFSSLLAAAASTDVNINGSNELHSVTSSRRYKKNEISSSLDISNYSKIKIVEYDFKEEYGGGHEHGIIAEDLDSIYPMFVYKKALIKEEEVLDSNGKVITEVVYGDLAPDSVQYSRLSLLNIKKIQELELRIKELESV